MKRGIRLIWIGFVLCVLLFSSCSLEKRHYRKGFYVSNHHGSIKKQHSSEDKQGVTSRPEQPIPPKEFIHSSEEPIVLASKDENTLLTNSSIKRKTILNEDDCGDLIIFKNGDELKSKVIEINEREIKYKRCDNLDGPLITVNKSDVFMIKYSNGTKEVFKDTPKQSNSNQQPKQQTTKPGPSANGPQVHPLAIASLVAGLLWLYWIGSIAAIITGAIALKRIKEQPDKYNGKGAAIAGIVLGAAAVALVVFVIFVIAAFGI